MRVPTVYEVLVVKLIPHTVWSKVPLRIIFEQSPVLKIVIEFMCSFSDGKYKNNEQLLEFLKNRLTFIKRRVCAK